jgi:uncharacterized RDD family membrane protein YckC
MNWYYVNAGQQVGPVDEAALEALLANGTITADTLVWKEGMANWLPYAQARSAAAGLITPAPPIVTQPMGGPAIAAAAGEAVCAECRRIFPVDDTISYGNVRVCAGCKPIFVQKLSEGMDVAAGPLRYAGFWIRFAAVFVDGLILKAVSMVMYLIAGFGLMGSVTGTPSTSAASGLSFLPFFLIGLQIFIALSYEAFFIGKYGATLGKMACKIQVVVADGSKVSYGRSIGRYFAKMLSSFTCLIGYIMAGFDDERRALHDRICNTRVTFK